MSEAKVEITTAEGNKKKRDDKARRRKDYLAPDNILKDIKRLEGADKFSALTGKYSELFDKWWSRGVALEVTEKKCLVLQREKDHLELEQKKLILARSRMEGLCRELQRQNKLIKDEGMAKVREEEEIRREVASKFQSALQEVSSLIQENSDKNVQLQDDNLNMAAKLEGLCSQFERRKDELFKAEQQMALERQLSEASLAQSEYKRKAEREQWKKEKELLQAQLKKSEETCHELQGSVKVLDENLKLYTGKYQEFACTISTSNQVFEECKGEMLRMSKQIAILEKEAKVWKHRWQKNTKSVVELTATKQTQDAKLAEYERKMEQLQKLCRQLQADRTAYIKQLKLQGVEPISQICSDESLLINTFTPKTQKEIELEHLKLNLKALQEQLKIIEEESAHALGFEPGDSPMEKLEELSKLLQEAEEMDELAAAAQVPRKTKGKAKNGCTLSKEVFAQTDEEEQDELCIAKPHST